MMTLQHCWWQIIVAAIVYFALGAVWFTPKVFGTTWMNSHGIKMDEDRKKEVNMGQLFGLSFICTLFLSAAVCYACCNTGDACGIMHFLKCGLLIGGAASAAISMAYVYQMKPVNAYLTDCGYHVVGCILAAFTLHLLGCC